MYNSVFDVHSNQYVDYSGHRPGYPRAASPVKEVRGIAPGWAE